MPAITDASNLDLDYHAIICTQFIGSDSSLDGKELAVREQSAQVLVKDLDHDNGSMFTEVQGITEDDARLSDISIESDEEPMPSNSSDVHLQQAMNESNVTIPQGQNLVVRNPEGSKVGDKVICLLI